MSSVTHFEGPRLQISSLAVVITVAMLVVSGYLFRQNVILRDRLNALPAVRVLARGASVPALRGWSNMHGPQVIDTHLDATPALVLVLAPSCPACDRNWPSWRKLITQPAEARDYRIVFVDLTGGSDPEYLRGHLGPSADRNRQNILTFLAPSSVLAYGFRATPQTLVLKSGFVAGVWTGVLGDQEVSEIQAMLIAGSR